MTKENIVIQEIVLSIEYCMVYRGYFCQDWVESLVVTRKNNWRIDPEL